MLAIALTYGGMLGKVYGEILESGEAHADHARCCATAPAGCRPSSTACCRRTPPSSRRYTVYRWECAIRSSVVLGFVGAGGLGQQLDNSMKMFDGGEVATMLLVFVALVALADRASALAAPGAGMTRDGPRRQPALPAAAAAVRRALQGVLVLGRAAGAGRRQLLDAGPAVGARSCRSSALASMGRFVGEFFPPDLSPAFLRKVLAAPVETLAMSALGTLLAVVGRPAAGAAGEPHARRRPRAWRARRRGCC